MSCGKDEGTGAGFLEIEACLVSVTGPRLSEVGVRLWVSQRRVELVQFQHANGVHRCVVWLCAQLVPFVSIVDEDALRHLDVGEASSPCWPRHHAHDPSRLKIKE